MAGKGRMTGRATSLPSIIFGSVKVPLKKLFCEWWWFCSIS